MNIFKAGGYMLDEIEKLDCNSKNYEYLKDIIIGIITGSINWLHGYLLVNRDNTEASENLRALLQCERKLLNHE